MLRRVIAGALVALVFISTAQAGPSCTFLYPRGVTVCTGGDLQYTWGTCVSRYDI